MHYHLSPPMYAWLAVAPMLENPIDSVKPWADPSAKNIFTDIKAAFDNIEPVKVEPVKIEPVTVDVDVPTVSVDASVDADVDADVDANASIEGEADADFDDDLEADSDVDGSAGEGWL